MNVKLSLALFLRFLAVEFTTSPASAPIRVPARSICSTWPKHADTFHQPIDQPLMKIVTRGRVAVLGQGFRVNQPVSIRSFRFFKSPGEMSKASRTGRIYSWPDGSMLATTTPFSDAACAHGGWVSIPFARPFTAMPNRTYVVAVDGVLKYAITRDYFRNSVTKGPLTMLAGGALHGYQSGALPRRRSKRDKYHSYWIDGNYHAEHQLLQVHTSVNTH